MLQILRSGALILALSGAALLAPGVRAQDDFVRGDVDSSGRFEVTDAIAILRALFGGEPERIACEDAADVDDSGLLAVTDAISLLEALFRGGPAPVAPFPSCGPDPTEDGLGCEAHEACRIALTFFGTPIEADAVFFVIDRSPQSGPNNLGRAKDEALQALDALPEGTRFALVFFDCCILRFPRETVPATADPATKESAKAFLESVPSGRGTCPMQALLAALDYTGPSTRRPVLLHVTDGSGTCQGNNEADYLQRMVDEVTAANSGRARIFTFGLAVFAAEARRGLEDLAARNGGVFTEVP
jgi:von Willebrand factor type A domain-containing protein